LGALGVQPSSSTPKKEDGAQQPNNSTTTATPKTKSEKNRRTSKKGGRKGKSNSGETRGDPESCAGTKREIKQAHGGNKCDAVPRTTRGLIDSEFAAAKTSSRSVSPVSKRTSSPPSGTLSVHPLTWVGIGLSWGFRKLSPAWRVFPTVEQSESEEGVEEDLD